MYVYRGNPVALKLLKLLSRKTSTEAHSRREAGRPGGTRRVLYTLEHFVVTTSGAVLGEKDTSQ